MHIIKRKKSIPFVVFMVIILSGVAMASKSGKLVVSRKEIQNMNVQNIPELLSRLSGIKAGDSSVTIRGSTEVKVFLNDMPINDPTSSHGGIRWDMISLEEVESITVYKGGTAEYGQDSSGGAVLITTSNTNGLPLWNFRDILQRICLSNLLSHQKLEKDTDR